MNDDARRSSTGRRLPTAPTPASLPTRKSRNARTGTERVEVSLELKLETPILGGAVRPRQIDEVDVLRVPSVRGQLRFWWRALHGHLETSSEQLYQQESAFWGRAADKAGGRSLVEVRIDVLEPAERDPNKFEISTADGAYALWPARKETNTPEAPRRLPGTRFRLTLSVPRERERELRDTVRAWVLFGGYGGRTRRGVGSLGVSASDRPAWLPGPDIERDLVALFGRDIFEKGAASCSDLPLLAGASLYVGSPRSTGVDAWKSAVAWLQEFRQGTSGARQPDPTGQNKRPSISNWPEPDKIRRLARPPSDHRWAHPPRHNATPVWPRAGFGLPIIGRFQPKARDGRPWSQQEPPAAEPDEFELRWQDEHGKQRDRLASPLILKAMPLANGSFVPIALWLNRAYPAGEVVLKEKPRSAAAFDQLVAPGDTPRFPALAGKATLREAFLDWLTTHKGAKAVVP